MLRIVVVGGGFMGLAAARMLSKQLQGSAIVTVIDHREHFTFLPWLIDALAGEKTVSSVRADLAHIAVRYRFRFILGEVNSIDREQKRVFLLDENQGSVTPIDYDILVFGTGSKTNYYGITGAEEYGLALKTTEDVEAIHTHVQEVVRQAMTAQTEEEMRELLAVVGVGGGASGIEALAALRQFMTQTLQESAPELLPYQSYTLVQGAPQILPGFLAKTVQGATASLERQGIRLIVSSPVTKVGRNFVLTSKGERVSCGTLLWCGGIQPVQVPFTPDVLREANGTMTVDEYLRLQPDIYAAGDVVTYRQSTVIVPKNAQTSMQMGHSIAMNIIRTIRGLPLQRYRFFNKGAMITVGEDGYLQLPFMTIKTRFVKYIREQFYRLRFKELTDQSPNP